MSPFAVALIPIGVLIAVAALREDRDLPGAGIAAGGLALACTGVIGVISFTAWDPPDALRVATGVVGALAWVAALGAGLGGVMRGDRRRGWVALALAGSTLVAAVALASAAE